MVKPASLMALACVPALAAAFATPSNTHVDIMPRSLEPAATAFLAEPLSGPSRNVGVAQRTSNTALSSTPNNDDSLSEKFGGFTVKQRLREEVESPFRKVRLASFAFLASSAGVALYFSALAVLKANIGGYADAIPLEDALQTCAINGAGVIGFGALAARELKVGNVNLERIAKGGMLARLVVEPAEEGSSRRTLVDYRRASRVVIAAGGADYINRLAMTLCSDQLVDENTLPSALLGVEIVIVPVLIGDDYQATESKTAWRSAVPGENDRNFDSTRADEVVAFPSDLGTCTWNEYLKSDIETAQGQGFDVLEKGITITVKKNGRILRRATGLPPYGDYIGAMEVADGSRFGMPGDSERYGGP